MIFYFPQRLCHHSSNNVPRPPSLPLLGIGPFNPFDLAPTTTTDRQANQQSPEARTAVASVGTLRSCVQGDWGFIFIASCVGCFRK